MGSGRVTTFHMRTGIIYKHASEAAENFSSSGRRYLGGVNSLTPLLIFSIYLNDSPKLLVSLMLK